MRRFARITACLLSLAFLAFASPGFAQTSPQVVITSASADPGLVNLNIYGKNFSRIRDLQVTVSGFSAPLAVVSSNDTSITALLPLGISAGSYTLTVGQANGANGDSIDITLAAQRPVATALSGLAGSPCLWPAPSTPPISLPSVVDVVVEPVTGRISFTCRPWPPNSVPQGTYEALAQSAATARAAIDFLMGSQNYPALATCAGPGGSTINCVNGVATPTLIHIEEVAVTVTAITPLSYSFAMDERAATVTDMQYTFQGASCSVGFDSARSGSPTLHITGNIVLDSNPPPDPPNRLSFVNYSVNPTLELGDLVVTGPPTCNFPGVADEFRQMLIQQFTLRFSEVLCGAPGPTLFQACQ